MFNNNNNFLTLQSTSVYANYLTLFFSSPPPRCNIYLGPRDVLGDLVDCVQQPLDGAGDLLDCLQEGPTVSYLIGDPKIH